MPIRLLSIDSDINSHQFGSVVATLNGVNVDTAKSVPQGLDSLRHSQFDAVIAAFPMQDWFPEELLEEIQRVNPSIPVIVQQPDGSISDAVRLTKLGAYYFLGSDATPHETLRAVESAAEHYRLRKAAVFGAEESEEPWRRFLVGDSRAMRNVMQVIRLIGARRSTVLITGETGTGKEIVARAIHMASPRSHLPMVAVNCSALPENLLEAELFGHVKGAFTGAVGNRIGRFEQANRSTIFLDEIGDMPMDLQAKLLRVLQEREFQRLGSSETIRVDVRVLAASNVDLVERIREGKFREDLYYRLNVVPLNLPALRERVADISLLVHHFIDKVCQQEDLPPRQVTAETLQRLAGYNWPGNVRQLENAVEMAVALSGDREVLYPSDFPLPSIVETKPVRGTVTPIVAVPDDGLDFEQTVGKIERAILEQAMHKTGGNKKQAAEMLHLKRTTFSAKLKSLEEAVSGAASCAHACAAN